MKCNVCNTNLQPNATVCSRCGTGVSAGNTKEWSMGWYKFLIYCSLFLGALVNLIGGIQVILGSQYTIDGVNQSEWIYSLYSGLKTIDFIYGVILISLSVLCILTRQKLKNFKKQGPSLLLTIYAINVVIAIIYFVLVSTVTKISISDLISAKDLGSLTGSAIMVIVNKIYFSNRSHLFVN